MQLARPIVRLSIALLAALSTTSPVASTTLREARESVPIESSGSPSAASAEARGPSCGFQLGFQALYDLMPERIGVCLADEWFDPASGLALQPTTRGVLAWRQVDNLTAFTDGVTTWMRGSEGIVAQSTESIRRMQDVAGPDGSAGVAATAEVRTSSTSFDGTADRLPNPPNATPRQARFILGAVESARVSQLDSGVPASVTIAQAILESHWGESRLSREFHNYFGLKPSKEPTSLARESEQGRVVWFEAWEVVDGENVVQPEPFRVYGSAAQSFVDHGRFFLRNQRYADALAARRDPRQFAAEIARAGYATDPEYADKLIALMDKFNLYAYDLP